ncbi:hypothetical protein ACFPOU_07715 [Massilia jejuensis]|uniref:Uncharacterized protein n=1 Tax=Massilia jejuensis TaxID=648894 RepID=A0ABW0PEB6_9BURK
MTKRPSFQYPAAELVTRAAVDRALKYFQGIRTPSNRAEIQRKVNAMIDVGGLMLFRHRESLLLAALNDEQRAVLAEYQAVASAPQAANDTPSPHEADLDANPIESPAFH